MLHGTRNSLFAHPSTVLKVGPLGENRIHCDSNRNKFNSRMCPSSVLLYERDGHVQNNVVLLFSILPFLWTWTFNIKQGHFVKKGMLKSLHQIEIKEGVPCSLSWSLYTSTAFFQNNVTFNEKKRKGNDMSDFVYCSLIWFSTNFEIMAYSNINYLMICLNV